MNLDPDDPKLTAYALGELDDITRAHVEAELAQNPESARVVEAIRAAAAALQAELSMEISAAQTIGLGDERRESLIAQSAQLIADADAHESADVFDADERPSKTPLYHVLTHPAHQRREGRRLLAVAGIAAALLLALGSIAALLTNHPRGPIAQTQPAPARPIMPFVVFPGSTGISGGSVASGIAGGADDSASEAAFLSASEHPVSSFPMTASTASYADVRRSIAAGRLPSRDSVRIEEMVNAFAYHYPAPRDAAFAADIEVSHCPWTAEHRLVRIGIKAREAAGESRDPIARDVTASVEFNPAQVATYRLIGYDRREGQSSRSGSDVAPGQELTALYEVVPAAHPTTAPADANHQLLALTLRYRLPGAADSTSQQFAAIDSGRAFPQASADFQFAAAVASFGMILRDAPTRSANLDTVLALATAARGSDEDGSRAAFADLVKKARDLKHA